MKRHFRTWAAAAAVVIFLGGLGGGYLIAHRQMGRAPGGEDKRIGEMETMAGMEGMPMPPPGDTGQASVMVSPARRQLIGVKTAAAESHVLRQVIRSVGKVTYDESRLTEVTLKVEGWIQDLYADYTGRFVRKGEPLFSLYSPELVAAQEEYLLAARNRAAIQTSNLPEARAGAVSLLESSRRRLLLWNLDEGQIRELEERGQPEVYPRIYSPISGFVIEKRAVKGMRVTPDTTLYRIADVSTVWVNADVYEQDLRLVRPGQPAAVTIGAYPGREFKGRVAFIFPYLNPETRTVTVRVELPNPRLELKPEMFADVEIRTTAGKVLTVPEEAVVDSGARQIVFVEQGEGMFEPRTVKTGIRADGLMEVTAGLSEGEHVVTSANFLIDSESKLMAATNMMGALGMGGVRMEQGRMGEMEMGPMEDKMEGTAPGKDGAQQRRTGDLVLELSTRPDPPAAGGNRLRLKLTDRSGKPIRDARVKFSYTMAMPGMMASSVDAVSTAEGYEANATFAMAGAWEVTAIISRKGKQDVTEKFTLTAVMPPGGSR